VLQHTPLVVTAAPPSPVTLPPDEAVVRVMADTPVVVTVGGTGSFSQEFRITVAQIKRIVINGTLIISFMTLVLGNVSY